MEYVFQGQHQRASSWKNIATKFGATFCVHLTGILSIPLRTIIAISGESFALAFASWLPVLGTLDFEPGFRAAFVAAPLRSLGDEPPLHHASVSFASGMLLMADWMRVAELSEIVDADTKALPDVCSEYGRIDLAKHYAERSSFVSVHVGNSLPMMCTFTDGLLAARQASSDQEVFKIGRVCRWKTEVDLLNI